MPRFPPELIAEVVKGVGNGLAQSDDSFRDLLSASRVNREFAQRSFARIWEVRRAFWSRILK